MNLSIFARKYANKSITNSHVLVVGSKSKMVFLLKNMGLGCRLKNIGEFKTGFYILSLQYIGDLIAINGSDKVCIKRVSFKEENVLLEDIKVVSTPSNIFKVILTTDTIVIMLEMSILVVNLFNTIESTLNSEVELVDMSASKLDRLILFVLDKKGHILVSDIPSQGKQPNSRFITNFEDTNASTIFFSYMSMALFVGTSDLGCYRIEIENIGSVVSMEFHEASIVEVCSLWLCCHLFKVLDS